MTANDWRTWLVALCRPVRVDDEEVPFPWLLPPWWAWRDVLAERYGAGNVQRVEPAREPVYVGQLTPRVRTPAPTDGCALRNAGSTWCGGSCARFVRR